MAPTQVNNASWTIDRGTRRTRGARSRAETEDAAPIPSDWLTSQSTVADSFIAQPVATRGVSAAGPLDISLELTPGATALLALRHPSGAITFHRPVTQTSRGLRQTNQVRFVVPVRADAGAPGTRGLVSSVIKAAVIEVAKLAGDKLASLAIGQLAALFETAAWKQQHLHQGWVKVTPEGLKARSLTPEAPSGKAPALLLLHGPLSTTAGTFAALAASDFFERVRPLYGDRIYGFDHFSISLGPDENARLLLESLPTGMTGGFDVVAHSRGALVLRCLVERPPTAVRRQFPFRNGLLVASPNAGTPLATPERWDQTVGWFANLLEMFPDNPFTTGTAFVANAIVWMARHAVVDLPGLQALDGESELVAALRRSGPAAANGYSALASNYRPVSNVFKRMLDAGVDQFFASANDLIVPTAGGWQLDAAAGRTIAGDRIGCFGAGGNLEGDDVTHLGMFKRRQAIDFVVETLSGKTHTATRLDPAALPQAVATSTASSAAAPTARRRSIDGPEERTSQPVAVTASGPRLKVTLVNGDMKFELAPLLLGHYRATVLTGTERVMNTVIGGSMKQSLDLGVYPLAPGTQQIFVNKQVDKESPQQMPRPAAVIVAGLGEEGKLRPADLVLTVRQAVIAWAQRMAEAEPKGGLVLAAALVGSGGTGINIATAAQGVAQGVYEANALLLRKSSPGGDAQAWPIVEELKIVELYLDRATDAWRAVNMLAEGTPDRYDITPIVARGTGALMRSLDIGYRGADYDFITVVSEPSTDSDSQISYTLDTRRARSEVRAQRAQGRLLRDLIRTASNDRSDDPNIGRTLFKLLVPIEIEPFLASAAEMQIELNGGTAGIPWELLDTEAGHDTDDPADDQERMPWAIRAKLLRKLKTADFRPLVLDAGTEASVLVIGEPACPSPYRRLPGARREAQEVCSLLTSLGGLRSLIAPDDDSWSEPDARTVINTLLERDWRIVHIAGHGAPPEPPHGSGGDASPSDDTNPLGSAGGVVLSNGALLGPTEIRTMRVVPELVFFNCCHLAARDIDQALTPDGPILRTYNRPEFAAGVAEELIRIGVRCVIAAGWAVEDAPAAKFATTFYTSIMEGNRFIDAVATARRDAWLAGGNTWAAYQCYGDPDWVLHRRAGTTGKGRVAPPAAIASASALLNVLDTIVVETKFQHANPADQLKRLDDLAARFTDTFGGMGSVAEGFGGAYVAARNLDKAIAWYERSIAANDSSASIKAAEQLGNLRARRAWERVSSAESQLTQSTPKRAAKRKTSKAAAGKGGAKPQLLDVIEEARKDVLQQIEFLTTLVKLQPTLERESGLGSALKRLSMIEAAATRHGESRGGAERKAIEGMRAHYFEAQKIGTEKGARDIYYPAMNYLAADVALHAGEAGWKLNAGIVKACRASLEARSRTDADFWSVAGQTELRIYEALEARKLATTAAGIDRDFSDLAQRVSASWLWASVYDNARFAVEPYTRRSKSETEKSAVKAVLAGLARRAGATT